METIELEHRRIQASIPDAVWNLVQCNPSSATNVFVHKSLRWSKAKKLLTMTLNFPEPNKVTRTNYFSSRILSPKGQVMKSVMFEKKNSNQL